MRAREGKPQARFQASPGMTELLALGSIGSALVPVVLLVMLVGLVGAAPVEVWLDGGAEGSSEVDLGGDVVAGEGEADEGGLVALGDGEEEGGVEELGGLVLDGVEEEADVGVVGGAGESDAGGHAFVVEAGGDVSLSGVVGGEGGGVDPEHAAVDLRVADEFESDHVEVDVVGGGEDAEHGAEAVGSVVDGEVIEEVLRVGVGLADGQIGMGDDCGERSGDEGGLLGAVIADDLGRFREWLAHASLFGGGWILLVF